MRRFFRLLLTILLSSSVLVPGISGAEEPIETSADQAVGNTESDQKGDRTGLQEWGILAGYGPSSRDGIFLVPLFGRAAWLLPDIVDKPLSEYDLNLKWVVEAWVAGVFDGPGDAFEGGIAPIVLKLDYDAGQRFVPYGIGGVGAMYTGLQGQNLGGPFEFASFVGVGLHTFLTDNLALTLSWRIRHISNAGIKQPNKGLNTNFFLIGLESFPKR